jgi:hypothetical protein
MFINRINHLPTELINIILEYQGFHSNRNGKYIQKLVKNDPKYKILRRLPKLSKIYRNLGYEINFIKQIFPHELYKQIYDSFVKLKCEKCNQIHNSDDININNNDNICISNFMRTSIDYMKECYELYYHRKFNIKTIIFNEKVIWTMTTYNLTPKNYSHGGNIHWEETEKNKMLFITHR